ncbi:MAG: hypothetical protein H7X95_08325 [Deltaproteobacteria bacterium]|nr:hypothetical protein [Deltaproteobacteria bacterium]
MGWLTKLRRALTHRQETGWIFAAVAAAVYGVVLVIGHVHHEMWRDEVHFWSVARDSNGLWDLLTGERKYEGHPYLWYYLLHLASRVTRSLAAMHLVTASLAIGAALLWLRYASIPRLLRVLLLASYYVLYEYGVMCRAYTVGVLLLFVFCTLYHPYRIRYVLLAAVLGLLSATSMYGTLMALALGFFVFSQGPRIESGHSLDGRRQLVLPADWLAGLLMFVAGLALTVVTTWPPDDSAFRPGNPPPVTITTIQNALAKYWTAMFPYGGLGDWNWPGGDHLFINSSALAPIIPWLGAAWFVLWLVALRRSPRLAITYGLGALLMATSQHTVYPAGWRHLGHYFILLVACIWLYSRHMRTRAPDGLLHGLFVVNLAVQIVTGVVAWETDYRKAFSRAGEAAQFILDHHLEGQPIVGDTDHQASGVAAALDKPIFFPTTGETAKVIVFHNRRSSTSPAQILDHAQRLARAAEGRALAVVNYSLPLSTPGLTTSLLYSGGPGIMGDESFNIYQVTIP